MLRLHWSYQYSRERCTSLLLLVNHFWTHKPSGLVAVCWIFTCTKTGLKLNYFINDGCIDIFIRASHLHCDNYICNLFEKRFNYGIFKTLLKFIWPVPATGINYLWLSFFFPPPCSSMMHAILAIIKPARVWCCEYVTDDECIISWGMLCIMAMY